MHVAEDDPSSWRTWILGKNNVCGWAAGGWCLKVMSRVIILWFRKNESQVKATSVGGPNLVKLMLKMERVRGGWSA